MLIDKVLLIKPRLGYRIWTDPKLIVFFVGLIVQLFWGVVPGLG